MGNGSRGLSRGEICVKWQMSAVCARGQKKQKKQQASRRTGTGTGKCATGRHMASGISISPSVMLVPG
eukprot:scaffold59090_cov27-Tisochrysis_lutea.AAC.1